MAGSGSIQVQLTLSKSDYERLAVDAGLSQSAFEHWWNTKELRESQAHLVDAANKNINTSAAEALKPLVTAETARLKGLVLESFKQHKQLIGLGRFSLQLRAWANSIVDQNKHALGQLGIKTGAELLEQTARIQFGLVKPDEVGFECDCAAKCECHCNSCGCC